MNKFSEQNRNEKSDRMDKTDQANKAEMADKMDATPVAAKTIQVTPAASMKGKWPQQVKAAKSQWGKLSESEILKSDGNPEQLSSLVQRRYDISRDVAEKQVHSFLDKCNLA